MSRTKSPHMDIVRLEDKESKLKSFISQFLQDNRTAVSSDRNSVLLLIVRSLESPAAKAVAALAEDGTLDLPVRAIVAVVGKAELDGPSEGAAAFFAGQTVRAARDPRLLDAHEQIVLGPATSWVGDCMRRDPMKRDAYECYAADCSETARWARISFERLWQASVPVEGRRMAVDSVAPTVEACPAVVPVETPEDPATTSAG